MKLKSRILALVVPSVVGVVLLGLVRITTDTLRIDALAGSSDLVELAIHAGRLVHEAQKERGMSSGFLASGRKKFVAELPEQRRATDAAAKALTAMSGELGDLDAGTRALVERATKGLDGLTAMRGDVDLAKVAPAQSFTFYSGFIDQWIAVVEDVARASGDGDLAREATAYLRFLRGKEQAGRERATLNGAFAADTLDAATYRRFLSIIAVQDAHFAEFRAYAAPEAIAAFDELAALERFPDVAELRGLAIERGIGVSLGVEAKRWFDAITRRIDAMKKVEDRLASGLAATIASKQRAAALSLGATLLFVTAALGVGLVLARRNARWLVESLGGEPDEVVEAARRLAAGDLSSTDDTVRSDSILGAMNATNREVGALLREVCTRLEKVARGELPDNVETRYPGVYDGLRTSLNTASDALRGLITDTNRLVEHATAGRLAERADTSRHAGEFARVVGHINETLDAVVAPIDAARAVLQRLAARDLTARVEGRFVGDHALIAAAINATAEELQVAVSGVAEAVGHVATEASSIADTSRKVAGGAADQARALAETASTIEGLTLSTRLVAAHTDQARGLAESTKGSAQVGAKALDRSAKTIAEARQAADATVGIVKDITQIATQTSFLALNAAIEAGRAGASGRGFAVVADEIRGLAGRANAAATKTDQLIRLAIRAAAEGESAVKDATTELTGVVTAVDELSGVMQQIAGSTAEQVSGIEQVNFAIAEIEKVTKSTATESDASAASSSELAAQAQALTALVGAFRIDAAPGGARPVRAASVEHHAS
ncbi:methyl-accepting chemotaxis protein [Myxococcota bacterium]|nr:methyl-accepting chemotaxis protein [Myxococcota bacterium]